MMWYSGNHINDILQQHNNNFVEDLEKIYQTYSIYRAIIITDIKTEQEYTELLEQYNHSVRVINTITDQDYDNIDDRILLMNYEVFNNFMDYFDYDIINTSFNLIAYTYDIKDNIKNNLVCKYNKLTKNNANNTIII